MNWNEVYKTIFKEPEEEVNVVLTQRIKELESELKWKNELLNQRTKILYDVIQQSHDALNYIPEGMVK